MTSEDAFEKSLRVYQQERCPEFSQYRDTMKKAVADFEELKEREWLKVLKGR